MKFFAVASTLFAAASAEAFLPQAYNGLYSAGLPYAAAYGAPAYGAGYAAAPAVTATYAAGVPVTALNALPAAYAAAPAVAAAPIATATYAAAPAVTYAAAPAVAAAPVAYAAAPVAAAPSVASSQFQAQDEFGNVAYGYQNINSAKQESGNALGGVTGSYTYADEAGVHTVNYIADALGFRVQADNLPVAPVHAAAPLVAPVHTAVPVVDTAEVVEAKAAFFQAYEAAKAGVTKRSADAQVIAAPAAFPYAAGYGAYAAAPLAAATYGAYAAAPLAAAPLATATYAAAPIAAATYAAAPAIAAPIATATYAAAPAVAAAPSRDAVLTTIKLNPGHATFYRVD